MTALKQAVQREMEHFFGRFLNDTAENGGAVRGWRAAVAMWDEADKVFLEVELPGVKKDSIDLTIHNGLMRISGERKAPETERNYWVNERLYGAFDRAIALPEDVDPDSIDAQLTDGVLHIVLSKKPEAATEKDRRQRLGRLGRLVGAIAPRTKGTWDESARQSSSLNNWALPYHGGFNRTSRAVQNRPALNRSLVWSHRCQCSAL